MAEPLLRYWHREVQPALVAARSRVAFVALLAVAVLINKRYLADPLVGGSAAQRWQCLGAWLLACLVLIAVGRAVRSRAAVAILGGLLGAVALAASITLEPATPGEPLRWTTTPFLMMLLCWVVVAPASAAASDRSPRPVAGYLWALGGLLAAALVCSGRPPFDRLLTDGRYDKLNWCLLTAGWLGCAPLCLSLARLGGAAAGDGVTLGRWRFWLPWTILFGGVMVAVVVGFAGRQPEFVRYYPMFRADYPGYQPARDGWGFFLLYEAAYGLYFLAWEFFFRGWLLFRLERDFGADAIWLQTMPFVLMHVGKPPLELHSSLAAGVLLGWLAWRGRSFWPCFLVHWTVAATMDLTALLHGATRWAG